MYLDKLNKIIQEGKKIAVIGLGKENQQFLSWLTQVVNFPAENIILADKSENLNLEEDLTSVLAKSEKLLGSNYLDCLQNEDLEWVFKAPGIHSLKPEFLAFRQKKGNWTVTSSLIFFIEKFGPNIIGVTGTKGKSTTSSLILHILNGLGSFKADYCGNTTGISPYSFWKELNFECPVNNFWVIELSSFQLQDIGLAELSPSRSVITNYYIDHLDQHSNAEEYWNAKDQIFLYNNSFLVANQQIQEVSKSSLPNSKILISSLEATESVQKLQFKLPGEHNKINLALALAIVSNAVNSNNKNLDDVKRWVSQNIDLLNSILPNFQGLPHRYEKVREVNLKIDILEKPKNLNIIFVDDGYATEPDAVAAAIKSVPSTFGNFLWLWLAGVDKGSGLKSIVDAIFEKQLHSELYSVEYCGAVGKRVLTELYHSVGSHQEIDAIKFRDSVAQLTGNLDEIENNFKNWLNDLIEELKQTEQDEVLTELENLEEINLHIVFSPGGSSFDEFKNVGQRAEWWVQWVRGLK